LNADDSALNEEAKVKQATCMKTLIETRVKIWCLACANKEAGKDLNTTNLFANGGVLVKKETCEALITDCGQVFAFMRRLREADKIMRKAKATSEVPPPKRVLEGEDLDIEDNTDADLDGDKQCVDNIADCKTNDGRRQGMCGRFNLFKDDPKVFGDGKVMKLDPSAIPAARILVGGSPTTENANGAAITQIQSGYAVQATDFNDPTPTAPTSLAFVGKIAAIVASLMLNMVF